MPTSIQCKIENTNTCIDFSYKSDAKESDTKEFDSKKSDRKELRIYVHLDARKSFKGYRFERCSLRGGLPHKGYRAGGKRYELFYLLSPSNLLPLYYGRASELTKAETLLDCVSSFGVSPITTLNISRIEGIHFCIVSL